MMSPMTRVFFGFPAENLSRDTLIGRIAIEFDGYVRADCSLRYSNNSMEVLTLPIPVSQGPPAYDQETLLFERVVDNSGTRFLLSIGAPGEIANWIADSSSIASLHSMRGGRQWGVF